MAITTSFQYPLTKQEFSSFLSSIGKIFYEPPLLSMLTVPTQLLLLTAKKYFISLITFVALPWTLPSKGEIGLLGSSEPDTLDTVSPVSHQHRALPSTFLQPGCILPSPAQRAVCLFCHGSALLAQSQTAAHQYSKLLLYQAMFQLASLPDIIPPLMQNAAFSVVLHEIPFIPILQPVQIPPN